MNPDRPIIIVKSSHELLLPALGTWYLVQLSNIFVTSNVANKMAIDARLVIAIPVATNNKQPTAPLTIKCCDI